MESGPVLVTSRVCPSGRSFTIAPVPTDPPAPARLSTRKGLPKTFSSFSVSGRTMMSEAPPGA